MELQIDHSHEQQQAQVQVGPYVVTSVRLGEGGQVSGPGEGVFRGHDVTTGRPVAVKRFNFAWLARPGAESASGRASKYTRLKREVENSWRVSGHPSIVTLGDVLFDASREFLLLVMELGDGRDLFEHVAARGRIEEAEAAAMFKQVAEGVRWVHSLGVCHRDLKLENILLSSDGRTVKIADFGMSKDFHQSLAQTRQHIGTLAYLAPELFDDLAGGPPAYSPEPIDVWAMGVMLFVMVCGDYPFGTDDPSDPRSKLNTIRAIRAGTLSNPRLPLALSPLLQDLLRRCLDPNPASRITTEEMCAHPWLSGVAIPANHGPEVRPPRDWAAFWPAETELDAVAAAASSFDTSVDFMMDTPRSGGLGGGGDSMLDLEGMGEGSLDLCGSDHDLDSPLSSDLRVFEGIGLQLSEGVGGQPLSTGSQDSFEQNSVRMPASDGGTW